MNSDFSSLHLNYLYFLLFVYFPGLLYVEQALGRILKMGVQILSGPKAHLTWRRRRHVSRGVWGHAPPENFEKLKHLRRDFRDSEQL